MSCQTPITINLPSTLNIGKVRKYVTCANEVINGIQSTRIANIAFAYYLPTISVIYMPVSVHQEAR